MAHALLAIFWLALVRDVSARARLAAPAGRSAVELGAAGQFALLTTTGATTAGATAITGDIGVSPAAVSYFTGFLHALDSGGAFSTSIYVTGKIFAANHAAPTPVP
tara:strand:- start:54 stop:371 length:318 start_codon:yes stop_codon:yes gene_type:complete|eukprot:scaffold49021_cov66-Phaeocystis_antarctica.AAC.3